MHRLFLDANVLFSAAYRPKAGLIRLWDLSDCVLLTSDYAIEETRRNLADPEQLRRLEDLLRAVERVPSVIPSAELRSNIELREKDWPILGAALAAGATHLVTGDHRDFGVYFGRVLLGTTVLTPGEYLRSRACG